jgi:hypothetical protein
MIAKHRLTATLNAGVGAFANTLSGIISLTTPEPIVAQMSLTFSSGAYNRVSTDFVFSVVRIA